MRNATTRSESASSSRGRSTHGTSSVLVADACLFPPAGAGRYGLPARIRSKLSFAVEDIFGPSPAGTSPTYPRTATPPLRAASFLCRHAAEERQARAKEFGVAPCATGHGNQ